MHISIQNHSPVALNSKKAAHSPFSGEPSLFASFFTQHSFKNHFNSRKPHTLFKNLRKRNFPNVHLNLYTCFSVMFQSSNSWIPRWSLQTIWKHWTLNLDLFWVCEESNFTSVTWQNQVKYKSFNKWQML